MSEHPLAGFYLEDVEFLAENGCGWDEVARRVGSSHATIQRRLIRQHRRELIMKLTRNGATSEQQ